eukprot:CAMPEP_0184546454 /NCGR_PEP_ID=MMETSP0199_2-20130426/4964_1 /TAXON_ID=1112570 /ORGANISM="Thraustochytrium sp., Strain LLF1b" /LENGTH=473 /DNA_ID=CAMNT_0026940863 /DNA_START=92 /DNA_END=1514 /DNA_ORIENTATION=-
MKGAARAVAAAAMMRSAMAGDEIAVVSWGNSALGGDATAHGVEKVFPSFAVLGTWKRDGGWEDAKGIGSVADVGIDGDEDVESVAYNFNARVIVRSDGTALTYGSENGGDSSTANFESGVKQVASTERAFAALKTDGSLTTWGDEEDNAHLLSHDLQVGSYSSVVGNMRAFAAISTNNTLLTWGKNDFGGNSSEVYSTLVKRVYPGSYAFAAITLNDRAVTWGDPKRGGGQFEVSDVRLIVPSYSGFAFLRFDGSVISWASGVNRTIVKPVRTLATTWEAFAAIHEDGSVMAWGKGQAANTSNADLSGQFTRLEGTYAAFAALREDGSVVTWGDPRYGGDSSGVDFTTGVREIYSGYGAFVALKNNGEIVAWGDPSFGGVAPKLDYSRYTVVDIKVPSFNVYKGQYFAATLMSTRVNSSALAMNTFTMYFDVLRNTVFDYCFVLMPLFALQVFHTRFVRSKSASQQKLTGEDV